MTLTHNITIIIINLLCDEPNTLADLDPATADKRSTLHGTAHNHSHWAKTTCQLRPRSLHSTDSYPCAHGKLSSVSLLSAILITGWYMWSIAKFPWIRSMYLASAAEPSYRSLLFRWHLKLVLSLILRLWRKDTVSCYYSSFVSVVLWPRPP